MIRNIRHKGLDALYQEDIAVAHLIQEIEASGMRTYWDCAKQNLASAAVARKLGYRIQKEYRCMVWDKVNG